MIEYYELEPNITNFKNYTDVYKYVENLMSNIIKIYLTFKSIETVEYV